MSQPPEPPRDSAGRMIVSGLLVLIGIAGLLATLCGGVFALVAIAEGGAFILAIALPSLAIGGLVAWACFRAVGRRHRSTPAVEDAEP
jgi:hypothetical protein